MYFFQATGGQDNVLRIWVLKEQYAYFDDMRQKYSEGKQLSFKNDKTLLTIEIFTKVK